MRAVALLAVMLLLSAAEARSTGICRVAVVPDAADKAVFLSERLWPNGSTLRVCFLDGDARTRRRVAAIAREWTRYANLDFRFYAGTTGDIRVTFRGEGFWSAIGVGSRRNAPRYSMSLYHIWEEPQAEFRKHVLHEFGHALGLLHEHQSPAAGIRWDRPYIYRYLAGPPNAMTPEQVDKNLFRGFGVESTNYSRFDPASIMLYWFPPEFTLDRVGTRNNTDLSPTDKVWIARMYPGRRS